MAMIQPGTIVLYKLTDPDAFRISQQRTLSGFNGNHAYTGDVYPAVVIRVWPDEFGQGVPGANLQVLLDGPDTYWVTSVRQGTPDEFGTWHLPAGVV